MIRVAALLAIICSLSAADYQLRANDVNATVGGGANGVYVLRAGGIGIVSRDESAAAYLNADGQVAMLRLALYLNAQPTLDAISNVTILEDSGVTSISLTGISDGSPTEFQDIAVSATSDNPALLLDPQITYNSPDATGTLRLAPVANQTGTATVTVRVVDAGGTLNGASNTITRSFTVTVTPVNDAPTLDQPADLTVNEDAGLQTVALTGITAGAGESQTLSIQAFSSDITKLPNPSVSYTSPNTTGSLSFTPVPDASGLVNILVVVSDSGGTANGGLASFSRVFSVNIQALNDPPALVTNIGLTVEETKSGIISFDRLRAIDDDPPASLVYQLTAIPTLGTLSLSGTNLGLGDTFTQADINAGSLVYTNTSIGGGSDSFDFFVSDPGALTTLVNTFTITIVPDLGGINVAPVVTLPGAIQTWTEGDSPLVIDVSATVSDGNASLSGGGQLTVTLISGGASDDVLAIRNIGTGAGQIGVSGNVVTYAGSTIGTFSGGSGGTPLSFTIGGSTTPAVMQALVRAITFVNTGQAPGNADRLIQFLLTDGDGGTSSPVVATIKVVSTNSPPSLAFVQTTLAYAEDSGAVQVDNNAILTDSDSPDFAGGAVVLTLTSGGSSNDFLGVLNQGGGPGQIGVIGSNIAYGGTVIGVASGGNVATPLSITLNSAADEAAVQALVRALTFRNDSNNFSTAPRQLSLSVSDGDGGTSSLELLPVVMVATNDAPNFTTPTASFTYVEGDGSVPLAVDALVSDADSSDFDTGFLQAQFSVGGTADDMLDIANIGTGPGEIGISGSTVSYQGVNIGSYSGPITGTDVLLAAFNANATEAAIQALVRAIVYTNTSAAPTTGARQAEVFLTDGDNGTSPVRTLTINVSDTNSPPDLTLASLGITYIENDPATVMDNGVTITDADSLNFDGGALIISVTANSDPNDIIAIRSTGFGAGQIAVTGTSVFYSGAQIGTITTNDPDTLMISFNFAADTLAATALARAITFANSSDNPSGLSRTVAYVVTDGDGDASPSQSLTVNVTPVNDAPYAADSTLATVTVAGVSIKSFLPGTDPENDPMTFNLLSQPSSGSVTLDNASTGAITWNPGGQGADSFTYEISDDSAATSTVITVSTYVTSTDEPRPQAISSPPMSATVGSGFSYNLVVDTSDLSGTPTLDFLLVGDVPSGMTLTTTGNTTARIDWVGSGVAGDHHEFGVLFIDPTAKRAGYQPVHYVLKPSLLLGDG